MRKLDRIAGMPFWSKDRKQQRYEIFKNWMMADPMAALVSFRETTPPEEFVIYHPKLFAELLAKDRKTALDYVVELQERSGDLVDLSEVLEVWPKEDRAALEDFCFRLGRSENGTLVMETLVGDMVEYENPDVGWQWILANTTGSQKDRAVDRYFTRLALVNPDEAYRRLSVMPGNMLTDHLLPEIGKGMAAMGTDKALAWYETLPDSRQKTKVYSQIMSRFVAENPEEASGAVGKLPEGELKEELMIKLAWGLGSRDLKGAFEWIAQQEWTPSTWGAYQDLTNQWARKDPVATVSFLVENADSTAKERLLPGVLNHLVEKAFDQSLPIIRNLPEGAVQDGAIEIYCRELFAIHPDQAKTWLEGLEPGRFRDVASQGIVETALASDPEMAARIASEIGDGRTRLDLLKVSVTDVALRNPKRANELLDDLAISPADKASVLANLPKTTVR